MSEPIETAGPEVVNDEPGKELVIETNVEGLKDLAEQLAKMHQRLYNVVWECKTTAGDKQARRDRRDLVSTRTALVTRGAELKRDLRASVATKIAEIDADTEKLVGFVKRYEEPLDALITADETRRAAEKQARDDAEAERTAALRDRVNDIADVAVRAAGLSSAEIKAKKDLVTRIVIGEDYQEFQSIAVNTKATALLRLDELFSIAEQNEARVEAARVASERLAQLEHENAERIAREAQERADRERRDAEERRQREETEAADRQKRQEEEDERRRVADEQRERETAAERARHARVTAAADLTNAFMRITKRAYTATADGMLALVTELEAIALPVDLEDAADGVQKAKDEALQELHTMHATAVQREEEQRVARAAQERTAMAMQQIDGIRQQVAIAHVGRSPYYTGGNVADVEKIIAATEAWLIDAENFGMLTTSAQAVKDATLVELRAYLAHLIAKRDAPPAAAIQITNNGAPTTLGDPANSIEASQAEPASSGSQTPDGDEAIPLVEAGSDVQSDEAGALVPETSGLYASSEAESAKASPSGDEGTAAHADESAADSDGVTRVPVVRDFNQNEPIGWLEIRTAALPPHPDFIFSLAFRALEMGKVGKQFAVPTRPYVGRYLLQAITPVHDVQYIGYLRQIGRLRSAEYEAAGEALQHAVVALMKAATLKPRSGKPGPWIAPHEEMTALKAALRAIPLPSGQYYAEDGTLMTADGVRSVFDDLAE